MRTLFFIAAALVFVQTADATAPDVFRARFETTKGTFIIEVHREWAPHGADRFYDLVRARFFDDSRFFRVRAGFIAQFGIAGDPTIATRWKDERIPADPVRQSNTRGFVSYAMTQPDARTTQLFVSLADNSRLDAEGFAPIGRVVEGMEVVDSLYAGYGEEAGGGMRGGKQERLFAEGNRYLDTTFPELDHLITVSLVQPQAHQHDILQQFVELLSIPNLASDAANIERNAAAIQTMCEKRGLTSRLLRLEHAPPIVVADLRVPNAKRTIAFYAHYDGQPVDPARWTSEPWKPVMRDASGKEVDWQNAKSFDPEWRLYARSSGDDKAPIIAMLAALDAMHEAHIAPAVNLRFVFEGEEEAGSPHLGAYLEKYPDVLRPAAWILCDGPVHQSRRALLFFGARGTVDMELTLYGPVKGLHDGHYGNWVPNPVAELAQLIASMRDESGRILIKGFYDNVRPPSAPEREALAKIPNIEAELRQEFQIAGNEGEGKPLNDLLMLPALNVRGIEAGRVGAQASNTIQTEARASIDFRLVANETPASIKPLVEEHFRTRGFEIVRDTPDRATRLAHAKLLRVEWGSGYPPARTPLDLPLSREVAAIMAKGGHEPVRLPTMGGSIPMYLFQQPNDTPAIGLPIANHDGNQHAADENLRLQNLWDAIEIFSALFRDLGAATTR